MPKGIDYFIMIIFYQSDQCFRWKGVVKMLMTIQLTNLLLLNFTTSNKSLKNKIF